MKSVLTLLAFASAGALVAAENATVADAFARGKVSLHARLRFESVDQSGLKDSDALTLRTRLGFTTAPVDGLKAMFELENIVSPDGDRYNQAGLNPGGAGRAVVADAEITELNQAFLNYTRGKTTATLGRQRLVLDNARFIGDVGWRQNQQTFDAFSVQDQTLEQTTLTYAYLWQVNRIFGRHHAQGKFHSDSHVLNASYTGFKPGTVTTYAYLLDFDNAAAQGNATYGVSFAGAAPLTEEVKVTYRVELAVQGDYGSNTLNYATNYYAFEAGLSSKPGALALGYEELGSDGGISFRTPLATLHAFNGWADLFLGTPGNGLRDTYLKASANLPGGFACLGFYHWYDADRLGANYGRELDLQLTRKFGPKLTGTLKYAKFDRDLATLPNVTKLWLQVDFAY